MLSYKKKNIQSFDAATGCSHWLNLTSTWPDLTWYWYHSDGIFPGKSRTGHFETKPDTGFIGKGLTRHTNFVKGLFETIAPDCLDLSSDIFPAMIISCFLIALTAVLSIKQNGRCTCTMGVQITNGLVYDDLDSRVRVAAQSVLRALVWNIALPYRDVYSH